VAGVATQDLSPSEHQAPVAVWVGRLARLMLLGAGLGTLLGFCGSFGWGFDLFSHFRLQCAVGSGLALVGLAIVRWWRWAAVAASLLVVAATSLWPYQPWAARPADLAVEPRAGDRPRLRLAFANVLTSNRRHAEFLAWVAEVRPDVVVVAEMGSRWQHALTALDAGWPHRLELPREDNFGWGVFSRWPLEDVHIDDKRGIPTIVLSLRVETTSVRLVAVHPVPPMGGAAAASRDRTLDWVVGAVRDAPDPILVVGDLNATPWSSPFRSLLRRTRLVDTARGRWLAPTWYPDPSLSWLGALVGIPIDHALVGPGIGVLERQVGPDFGSDHRPLLVEVEWVGPG